MRQISDVISTRDGSHLLVPLTDGKVLYFRAALHENGPHEGQDSVERSASLVELPDLKYTTGIDSAWCIRRAGSSGSVMFVRAMKPEGSSGTVLIVKPLSGMYCDAVAF